VIVKSDAGEYCGSFLNDTMDGTGFMKFNDGSTLLGVFRKGILFEGVCLSKDKNGEVFFGSFKNNQRTGYGELRNSRGDMFFGEFLNGRLVKGYAKEVDQFGYSSYSRIDKGAKTSIDPQTAGDFFGMLSRQSAQ
jgi:hypothetical protein